MSDIDGEMKMTNKIFKSIFSVAITVLVSSLLIVSGTLYHYFTTLEQQNLKDELKLIANATEQIGEDYFKGLGADHYRITWINHDGSVLYDSHADETTMENHLVREEVKEAFTYGTGDSVRHSETLMEKTIYEAILLEDGTIMRISINQQTIWLLLLKMVQPILIIFVISMIASALMAQYMARKITEPINNLNLDKPLENDVYDEISPLIRRIHSQQKEITDQIETLKNKQEEMNQITNNMNEALLMLDESGKILSINPAALKLFEMYEEPIGEDVLVVNRKENMRNAIKEAKQSGTSYFREEINGKTYQFEVSRIDTHLDLKGFVIIAFDISEEVNAERNRKEFTANISHELKTPLQTIVGYTELIKNEIIKPENTPTYINKIYKEANRLNQLIEDIIRLSQLDEQQVVTTNVVSLKRIANEVVNELEETASLKNVKLNVLSEDDICINGSEMLLHEIIYNLCDNAIKYNKQDGYVNVSIYEKDNHVCLEVEDGGIGIGKEHHEKIFERFYRVDKSHSKKSGGTGLGLSIVKNAVKYHQGTIDIESELEKGTKITVKFNNVEK